MEIENSSSPKIKTTKNCEHLQARKNLRTDRHRRDWLVLDTQPIEGHNPWGNRLTRVGLLG
jgi:hypothetical protein